MAASNASLSSFDDANTTTKKSASAHESVILRTTTAADSRMKTAVLPEGKTASLPSTLSSDGRLLLPKTAAANNGEDFIGSFFPSVASDNYSTTSNSQNDQLGHNDSRITTARSSSPNRSSSAPGSVGSRGSRSRGSSRTANGHVRELFGPPQCLVLRIEGDIYPVETTNEIINKGPLNGLINGYIIPASTHHIPTSKSVALELFRAASNQSAGTSSSSSPSPPPPPPSSSS